MLNFNVGFSRSHVIAVADVGPGGASVSILSAQKDGPTTILASARSSLTLEPRTEEQEKARIGEQVKEAAALALKLYASTAKQVPITQAYAVVHAPWTRTEVISVEEHYDVETRIHRAHIEAAAKKALGAVQNVDASLLLEGSVIQVAINGYVTAMPEGKDGHSLKVTSIASDCDPTVRGAVEGAIHQSFPVATITWRTGIRALMTVAREASSGGTYLLVDMGVADTHIASVNDGVLSQLVIPEGTRTILSRVAASKSPEETLGFMRMLSRDACSTDACEAIKTAIATAEPELVRVFGEAIAKIAQANRVPNEVLLATHPDLESWLSGFLARIDFAQFTATSMPLMVTSAQTLDVSRWVAGAHTTDAPTLSAALVNIESRS